MAVIFASSGHEIHIDEDDVEQISARSWFVGPEGYAQSSTRKAGRSITLYVHRLLMGLQGGDKRCVDHINGNRLDNRRVNLRVCSNADNLRNRGKTKRNRSGFKGVIPVPVKNGVRWRAQINIGGKEKYLGTFATPEEAAVAYKAASIQYHGEFAKFD